METNNVLVLTATDVVSLLKNREDDVLLAVKHAYLLHSQGRSSLPHSSFLQFPQAPGNRIIALPAYLELDSGVAGVKWISSFPGNLELGIERASAVIILNSAQTGRPNTIMEGSVVSAKRTAASAALAALHLHDDPSVDSLGIIGAGLINFEVFCFLLRVLQHLKSFFVFDIDARRAEQFKEKCLQILPSGKIFLSRDIESVLKRTPLISIATTASRPHITSTAECPKGSTILHISLRDLATQVILDNDNIVDDVDHVCRAQTSIHLAADVNRHRDFIRGTLADVISGNLSPRKHEEHIVIFSPFGLGVLDVAVGKLVHDLAIKEGRGIVVESFFPPALPSSF